VAIEQEKVGDVAARSVAWPHDLYVISPVLPARYIVDLSDETGQCPDHHHRPEIACKHIVCAAIHRAKHERAPERLEDARRFHAAEYVAETSRLAALGVEEPEEDD
jgi:hypothetical protein